MKAGRQLTVSHYMSPWTSRIPSSTVCPCGLIALGSRTAATPGGRWTYFAAGPCGWPMARSLVVVLDASVAGPGGGAEGRVRPDPAGAGGPDPARAAVPEPPPQRVAGRARGRSCPPRGPDRDAPGPGRRAGDGGGVGHRLRDPGGEPGADLGSLLHDEAGRSGHRARALDLPEPGGRARRKDRRAEPGGGGEHLHGVAQGGGGGGAAGEDGGQSVSSSARNGVCSPSPSPRWPWLAP